MGDLNTENDNPHHICTWNEVTDCLDCELQGDLLCRHDQEEIKFFILNQLPYLLLSFFGMALTGIITGVWWPLFVYIVACIAFLGPVEMRVLCSHCPFYAQSGRRLHCIALNPFPKLFPYRPEPMTPPEKRILKAFALYLFSFPSLVQAYGVWFLLIHRSDFGLYALLGMIGINLATVVTVLQFRYILSRCFCSRCVNFSCPFNRVPKSKVDRYLERNSVMRDAWEREGYSLGSAESVEYVEYVEAESR